MNGQLRVVHSTTRDTLDKILSDGKLLPKSCIADMAKYWWTRLLFFLPKSFSQKGIFAVLSSDIEKWKKDVSVWDYLTKKWIPSHGKGPLVKISFELTDEDNVYVLDENVLYELAKKDWSASFWGRMKLMPKWRKVFVDFVNTKVRIVDYKGNYILPAVFIKNEILVSRITYEIM